MFGTAAEASTASSAAALSPAKDGMPARWWQRMVSLGKARATVLRSACHTGAPARLATSPSASAVAKNAMPSSEASQPSFVVSR